MQELRPLTDTSSQPLLHQSIETEEFQIDMVDFGPAYSYSTSVSVCVCGCVCGGCAGPFCACISNEVP
jgi:hypothetical protein